MTIIIDSEGAYVEELAAIAMNTDTLQIVDVFHEFALPQAVDDWSRKHVHGLNRNWLQKHANYKNQSDLVIGFRQWLCGKNVLCLVANAPAKERQLLGPSFHIVDLEFPNWTAREPKASHKMAFLYKRLFSPVFNKRCCVEAHSSFIKVPVYKNTTSELAKKRWGVHCALYDCLECYFVVLEERALRGSSFTTTS